MTKDPNLQPFLLLSRHAFGSPYFWTKGTKIYPLFFLSNPRSSVNWKKLGATSINHFGFIEQTFLIYYFVVKIS